MGSVAVQETSAAEFVSHSPLRMSAESNCGGVLAGSHLK